MRRGIYITAVPGGPTIDLTKLNDVMLPPICHITTLQSAMHEICIDCYNEDMRLFLKEENMTNHGWYRDFEKRKKDGYKRR